MRPYQEIESLLNAFESWQSGRYQEQAVYYHFASHFPGREEFWPKGELNAFFDWIEDLSFLPEEIQHLGSLKGPEGQPLFNESFLNYLQRFSFSCDIDIFPPGFPSYSEELLLRIKGPQIEIQLVKPQLEKLLGGALEEGMDPSHFFLIPVFQSGKLVYEFKPE